MTLFAGKTEVIVVSLGDSNGSALATPTNTAPNLQDYFAANKYWARDGSLPYVASGTHSWRSLDHDSASRLDERASANGTGAAQGNLYAGQVCGGHGCPAMAFASRLYAGTALPCYTVGAYMGGAVSADWIGYLWDQLFDLLTAAFAEIPGTQTYADVILLSIGGGDLVVGTDWWRNFMLAFGVSDWHQPFVSPTEQQFYENIGAFRARMIAAGWWVPGVTQIVFGDIPRNGYDPVAAYPAWQGLAYVRARLNDRIALLDCTGETYDPPFPIHFSPQSYTSMYEDAADQVIAEIPFQQGMVAVRPGPRLSVGGQAVSIDGVRVSLPLPRITITGKKFCREGLVFRGFGLNPLGYEFLFPYYRTGGEIEFQQLKKQLDGFRKCGANFIRMPSQLWDFIQGPDENTLSIKPLAFTNFIRMLDAARELGLYVIVSANNSWELDIIPAWYDELPYATRWNVQAFLWTELTKRIVAAGHSTTIWGYEVAAESLIDSSPTKYWYSGLYGGYYFVQFVARGVPLIDYPTVAQAYLTQLGAAVKAIDPYALCCLGGLMNGGAFAVENINTVVDFFEPHIYPPQNGTDPLEPVLTALAGWTTGPDATLPCVIGESSAWSGTAMDTQLLDAMYPVVEGYAAFSYGYPPNRHTFDEDGNARFPAEPWDGVEDYFTYAVRFALQGTFLQISLDYKDRFLTVYP